MMVAALLPRLRDVLMSIVVSVSRTLVFEVLLVIVSI